MLFINQASASGLRIQDKDIALSALSFFARPTTPPPHGLVLVTINLGALCLAQAQALRDVPFHREAGIELKVVLLLVCFIVLFVSGAALPFAFSRQGVWVLYALFQISCGRALLRTCKFG